MFSRSDSLHQQAATRRSGAFTLIEMLMVLVIIGIIAGLSLPLIRGHTESVVIKAAAHQLAQDLSFARQKAMSQRSTVAVVFLNDSISGVTSPIQQENKEIRQLQAGIYTHYALYGFRRVGEQPGQRTSGYLTEWKALPEKTFLSTNDAAFARGLSVENLETNVFPFPFDASTTKVSLPYIAFDQEGRPITITDGASGRGQPWGVDRHVAIARGAVFYGRDNNGALTTLELVETPPYNGTNVWVTVDGLTGRAKQEELLPQ